MKNIFVWSTSFWSPKKVTIVQPWTWNRVQGFNYEPELKADGEAYTECLIIQTKYILTRWIGCILVHLFQDYTALLYIYY
jgi:hypothetical protein